MIEVPLYLIKGGCVGFILWFVFSVLGISEYRNWINAWSNALLWVLFGMAVSFVSNMP